MAGAPRVVILNDTPPSYYAEFDYTLDPLRARASVDVYFDEAPSAGELARRLAGARAAIDIRALSRFDADLLARLPDLRTIVVRGTTAPLIDVAEATRLGVLICNTPFQSTQSVAEFTIGLLFAAARRIPLMNRDMQRGVWQDQRGSLLGGRTLGAVGLGQIGQLTCQLARSIGMRVLAWNPTPAPERAAACGAELVELDDLLRSSDAVSLHLRLSDRTRGVVDRRRLALIRDGAIFVNTGRAGLADEAALIEELRNGRLIGAIDVFGQEPIPADHPLVGLDNVILTPHAAWATDEVAESRARVPVDNVLAAMDGHPQNVLNAEALEHPYWRDAVVAPEPTLAGSGRA